MHFQHALTRQPPLSMADGITTQASLPDVVLARKQYENYIETLKKLGLSVTVLAPEEAFPDSHFVEDAAIIYQQTAILTRPGATARRGEVAKIKPALQAVLQVRELDDIDGNIVDGGDVLRVGNQFLIGISHRTSIAGATNLARILHEIDPHVLTHFIHFDGVLHLKSGLTALSPDLLMGHPGMQLQTELPVKKVIWLPKEEAYAANSLVVNDSVLVFAECKQTQHIIKQAGLQPIPLDMSEFRKMDGSFTCLSLLW